MFETENNNAGWIGIEWGMPIQEALLINARGLRRDEVFRKKYDDCEVTVGRLEQPDYTATVFFAFVREGLVSVMIDADDPRSALKIRDLLWMHFGSPSIDEVKIEDNDFQVRHVSWERTGRSCSIRAEFAGWGSTEEITKVWLNPQ
ncbi:hypothetical protein [Tianweitania sp.]|uniref:hypothetical protein n=1 Tax=Tianweitania sp. TaxID=2021634 RepID=UPI00289CB127|nr:hypothetical protein [Tianweitania sp.]